MQWDRPLSVIAPTLDTDVLAVLALADVGFTTGQLHRLLPAVSQEGIRKALARLVGQGIVDAERVGRAVSYRFNAGHLAAGPIIELAGLRGALLQRLEQRLLDWPVRAVHGAVFGSAARGSMRPDSDLDLFLVRPDEVDHDEGLRGVWEQQVDALVHDVGRWTGNDTRVLELSQAQVRGSDPAGVLGDVVAEGLTVAGARRWLTTELGAAVRP